MDKKLLKQLSKRHQSRIKKELETSFFSADPSTNPNWDQTSGRNSSLESEWSNLDSDSEIITASSEGNFDNYADINENSSAILDISFFFYWFPLEFRRKSHEEVRRSNVGGNPLGHLTFVRHSAGRKWRYLDFREKYAQLAAKDPTEDILLYGYVQSWTLF